MDLITLAMAKKYAESLALGGAIPIPGPPGFSPTVTVKTNTSTEYVLTVTTAVGSFDTPNLKGQNGGGTGGAVDSIDIASGEALIRIDLTDPANPKLASTQVLLTAVNNANSAEQIANRVDVSSNATATQYPNAASVWSALQSILVQANQYTEESVSNMTARQLTYDARGYDFPTYAHVQDALNGTTNFYNAGKVVVPQINDVIVILSDERYGYATESKFDGASFVMLRRITASTLTQAQMDAINSGATAAIISAIANFPIPPSNGNFTLQSVNGALQWV